MYLSRGAFAGFTPNDPVACASLRQRASEAAAQPDIVKAVRAQTERELQPVRREAARIRLIFSLIMTADRYGQPGGGGAGPLPVDGGAPKTGSVGLGRRGDRRFVRLTGLIPDGIADVRIRDRDPGAGGRRTPPVRIEVRDNVFAAELPRGMGPRMTVEWLDPDGKVRGRTNPQF